jgi:hypothetical protein
VAPVAPVAPGGGAPPKEMPKGPATTPPKQGAVINPPAPVGPAAGPRLIGTYSPY